MHRDIVLQMADGTEKAVSFVANGATALRFRLVFGCELIASIPKYKLSEGEETYSYMGSVILSEGSMVNAAGEVNEEEMSVTREFSPETTGRDNLSMADINTIKGIVGGFGNTAWGTIGGVMSGGSSAFSAAWTVLGFCGVVPTDSSRHSEVMNKLDVIHKSVKEVDEIFAKKEKEIMEV